MVSEYFDAFVETDADKTDLHGIDLSSAILKRVHWANVNLCNADLSYADLEYSILHSPDLRGANLNQANLKMVRMTQPQFDENTILPNGLNWRPDTDMLRFCNPNHEDFWRSDEGVWSPAFDRNNVVTLVPRRKWFRLFGHIEWKEQPKASND